MSYYPQGYPGSTGQGPSNPQGYPAPYSTGQPVGYPQPQQPGWDQPTPASAYAPAYAPPQGYPQQQYVQQQQHPQQHLQQHHQQHQHQQYHSTPQQQQQQQHGGLVQPRVVVVSPQFCLPQQVTLVMQESFGAFKGDDFNITDATGRTYFMLKASTFSFSASRALFDAAGQPCVTMERKALTMHGTWLMKRPGDGVKVAEVKPSMMSLSPSVKVYMNDGDKEPDYLIKGDFRAKSFSISECRNSTTIATVKRESKFSNMNAFMMSQLTNAQKYFLTIEPGVDAAFVTALATLVDEIFNDQQS